MRKIALLASTIALFAAACGSSDEEGSGGTTTSTSTSGTTTPFTTGEVEEAVRVDLANSGQVVDLGTTPPRLIKCKESAKPGEWNCRITAAKGGKNVLCVVRADPTTRAVTRRSCARVDY
jgi:hypothetical protein